MAKQRTKKVGWETVCTQSSPGVWCWKEGDAEWDWSAGTVGINARILVDGRREPVAHFAKLEHAVFFSYGVRTGLQMAPAIEAAKKDRAFDAGEGLDQVKPPEEQKGKPHERN